MKFCSDNIISRHILYAAININCRPGDEMIGLSIGRIYVGWYKSDGPCFGWIDDNECLVGFGEIVK